MKTYLVAITPINDRLTTYRIVVEARHHIEAFDQALLIRNFPYSQVYEARITLKG